jgi:hypothetical protein
MDGNVPFQFHEDDLFRAQADGLGIEWKDLDEKLLDITFVIARVPFLFPRVHGTMLYRAVYDGTPRLSIWFTFDGKTLILRSIEKHGPNEL